MKRIFLFVFLFSGLTSTAQKTAKPEVYANTITVNDLKKHLYIVAGKEMQGREATTEGERRAAAYIEGEFRRIGLQPGNNGSYRQFFPVYQDSLLDATLEVNGKKFSSDKDFNASANNIPAMHAFSEVVFIPADVSPDSLKTIPLAGKMIVVQGGTMGRTRLPLPTGLAAIVTISEMYPRRTPAPRKGNMTMQFFKRAVAPQQFTISQEVARAILGDDYARKYQGKVPVTVQANVLTETQKRTTILQSSNVIGVLPGTDLKDEYLVLTAHYDHEGHRGDSVIYYGADDDGSGTVSVIEIAEAFAKAAKEGKGPRRSIVFMTVSG